jgi:predicted HAD superfamily Cof-like phosphohydrolase
MQLLNNYKKDNKMNNLYDKVKEFHAVFNHPISERPSFLPRERTDRRAAWLLEEIQEFVSSNDVCEQVDAMIDLIYFALGTLVEMGVRPGKIFDIVHAANMAKLQPDGRPLFDMDGKIIKPPGWQSPEGAIVVEIENQIAEEAS